MSATREYILHSTGERWHKNIANLSFLPLERYKEPI